ncbi:hypothetical protein CK203_001360 [Vitis vinifera]|uniref:Uncharacterized protein n=1 Tax=Vitis vinifera TaxID=29760 RepID=A0A438KL90_VITVI|nr:hypothetical protein CK203_001360 [Vitis vinifera]
MGISWSNRRRNNYLQNRPPPPPPPPPPQLLSSSYYYPSEPPSLPPPPPPSNPSLPQPHNYAFTSNPPYPPPPYPPHNLYPAHPLQSTLPPTTALPYYANHGNYWPPIRPPVAAPPPQQPPPYVEHQNAKKVRNDVNVHKDTCDSRSMSRTLIIIWFLLFSMPYLMEGAGLRWRPRLLNTPPNYWRKLEGLFRRGVEGNSPPFLTLFFSFFGPMGSLCFYSFLDVRSDLGHVWGNVVQRYFALGNECMEEQTLGWQTTHFQRACACPNEGGFHEGVGGEILYLLKRMKERIDQKGHVGANRRANSLSSRFERELKKLEWIVNYKGSSTGAKDSDKRKIIKSLIKSQRMDVEVMDDPWCIGGNFNMIRFLGECCRGDGLSLAEEILEVTEDLELRDIPLQGGLFTWTVGLNNQP